MKDSCAHYKRVCKQCGSTIRYSELDEFIVCPGCGEKKENPHYDENKAKANARKEKLKAAFVYKKETADVYYKATRIMVYVILAVTILSLSIYGISQSCSFYGTYYDAPTFRDGETYYLDEMDKLKISPFKITEYVYVSPEKEKTTTSSYSGSSYTTVSMAEYYKKQGYEKENNTNYYKRSRKYKKVKTGSFTYLYVQDEETGKWDSSSIIIFEGKVYGGLLTNTKQEMKKIAKLKGATLKKTNNA